MVAQFRVLGARMLQLAVTQELPRALRRAAAPDLRGIP
jgi:hypothetical protein